MGRAIWAGVAFTPHADGSPFREGELTVAFEVETRAAAVWSEGSRLAAVVMTPKGAPGPRPAILLCHGWGGLKEHLVQLYAEAFVGAGYVCMAFDYRGWGESDGRLIPAADAPPLTSAGEQTLKVRVI